RIIFKDFETSNWTWDPVAKAYYWHRFYSHQPDLNFDNPEVRQAVKDVADFWFRLGVDAFRLDAIPYLYERNDTNCENLPETHAYLKELRAHIDKTFPGRMLLAEANQWPDDSVAYFGDGDECQMCFHFPVMPRLFMAVRMEDRYPIIDILRQTPAIPPNCQWAMFLRNHDELTLEMVTDEERDYMYRVYAQDRQARINLGIRRRLAPLLGNNRRRIELMNALLFSMPGTPVLYYGDEIGMGDNIYLGDRNGVRTPMQWNGDRNAGFSEGNPQRLFLPIVSDEEYHPHRVNVEAQQNNPSSLLWWMKRMIEQRKQYKAFGRGSIRFLEPENRKVLVFVRAFGEERLLVVANLSRYTQYIDLDLREWQGMVPVEVFGRVRFPQIDEGFYRITVGAYGFYWFALEPAEASHEAIEIRGGKLEVPVVKIGSFDRLTEDGAVSALTKLLPRFLQTRRWYGGKTRRTTDLDVVELLEIPGIDGYIALVRLDYSEGDPDFYILPVAVARGEAATSVEMRHADSLVARLEARDGSTGVLYGAIWDARFRNALLNLIRDGGALQGRAGVLAGIPAPLLTGEASREEMDSHVTRGEQSNTSMIFGEKYILKLFRKVEPGVNPDIEISSWLTQSGFANSPAFFGHIEYRQPHQEVWHIAILHELVKNDGDAWKYTLDSLSQFYENALAGAEVPARDGISVLDRAWQEPSNRAIELIGTYLESARLLGQRTAEMHLALFKADVPHLAPEPFTDHYRMGLYHAFISQVNRSLDELRRALPRLPEATAQLARSVLEREQEIREGFAGLRTERIQSIRIRAHGDLHLGQVLYTGRDFVIIDFEG
ncbi:MAG: alpha-glucosidase C-terminal domain-containing protein, partial [Bryobacteraceae bacterium]|nr:alpha-glucosidase C-terminal domain-containing protein [Bryobacteraceae bacterium]